MGIFSKILGSDTIVDSLNKGADAIVFTEEEKSQYKLQLLRALEPFRLMQKILVFAVGVPYVGVYILSMLVYLLSIPFPGSADALIEASKYLSTTNNDTLGSSFVAIMSVYFTGGVLNGAIRTYKHE
jgi:hypothetical protein